MFDNCVLIKSLNRTAEGAAEKKTQHLITFCGGVSDRKCSASKLDTRFTDIEMKNQQQKERCEVTVQ